MPRPAFFLVPPVVRSVRRSGGGSRSAAIYSRITNAVRGELHKARKCLNGEPARLRRRYYWKSSGGATADLARACQSTRRT